MKRILFAVICTVFLVFPALPAGKKTLDMWVIDTEGGKSLLLVSPTGKSMLVDTGFPGFSERDTTRILEACKDAGVTKLDILLTTHYDVDHVNNAPSLVAKMPVALFIDHGPAAVNDMSTTSAVKAYDQLWPNARHMVAKLGDKIPFDGVDVQVVTAARQILKTPLAGAGQPNAACQGVERIKTWQGVNEDVSENANALGLFYKFGKFRMLDLADLTWNYELDLMCPSNPIGTVDLFMVSHHGNNISNSQALVHAIQPRVAIMNNGARKIGAASAIRTIKSAPGLQALYMAHWSANAPNDNPPDEFLANIQSSPDGKWIKATAGEDGVITVTNGRTGETKTYKP